MARSTNTDHCACWNPGNINHQLTNLALDRRVAERGPFGWFGVPTAESGEQEDSGLRARIGLAVFSFSSLLDLGSL